MERDLGTALNKWHLGAWKGDTSLCSAPEGDIDLFLPLFLCQCFQDKLISSYLNIDTKAVI